MTFDIDELTQEELMQLKHYWCTQTDRRDSKCMLDGKVIWEGNAQTGGSCKGCPYDNLHSSMEKGDIVNIKKYAGGYWKGKITKITDRYNDIILYTQPIATINGIDNKGHAVVIESGLIHTDGEWWELKH